MNSTLRNLINALPILLGILLGKNIPFLPMLQV